MDIFQGASNLCASSRNSRVRPKASAKTHRGYRVMSRARITQTDEALPTRIWLLCHHQGQCHLTDVIEDAHLNSLRASFLGNHVNVFP